MVILDIDVKCYNQYIQIFFGGVVLTLFFLNVNFIVFVFPSPCSPPIPYSLMLFSVYFTDYAIIVPIFSLVPPFPPAIPSLFTSMDHAYMFFGFSISYTILNTPQYILYLPIMFLNPCIFSPILPPSLPADNPPCDVHFCDSLRVLVVCLVLFCFRFSC